MPPSRPERFNAKARKSVPGGGSHKKKKAKKSKDAAHEDVNPNAELLEHKSAEEKEANRREVFRQELLLSTKVTSSKKKKRLEKYIDKQLQKEERVVLLKKLAESQAQIPSNLQLQSSSTLGTGRPETAQQRAEKDEHTAVKRALSTSHKRHKKIVEVYDSDTEGNDGSMSDDPDTTGSVKTKPIIIEETVNTSLYNETKIAPIASIAIGGALKRNADGTISTPVMQPRKSKTSTRFASWKTKGQQSATTGSAPMAPESDFDSSDSELDSSGDEDEDNNEQQQDFPDVILESSEVPANPKKRSFKEWASEQIQSGITSANGEYTTYTNIEAMVEAQASLPPSAKRQKLDDGQPRGPMGERLDIPSTPFALAAQKERGDHKGRNVVKVNRSDEVRESRVLLPIIAEEQKIVEAVLLHPVVVICGETGSGKTTQVPQFLYEAGFGNSQSSDPGLIGITQPRRVAAVSMASRVAHELNLPASIVSYQIRYDTTTAPTTAIKFMTDGVLLREMATDFLLSRYSVIIVDEAHERNLNTDILIGTLSRIIKLREEMWLDRKSGVKPLRLIIMSATLRVSDFVENSTLFAIPPPIIEIDSRQHPVTIHFDKHTRTDYVTQAIRKSTKIHTRLPAGGILIFLTGQQEIVGVCKQLEKKYGTKAIEERKRARLPATRKGQPLGSSIPPEDGQTTKQSEQVLNGGNEQRDLEVEEIELGVVDEKLAADVDDGAELQDDEALDTDSEEEKEDVEMQIEGDGIEVPMHIVPLYSLLPSKKQMLVFEPPPDGSRLVVVATNVAETSLTIPGIKYVIDCGRAKERRYDISSGIQSFQVAWISKASAAQRAGRAGRTGPGHCYRLYSSSLFENYFDQYTTPEILRTPIDSTVLQMKSMHIDSVANFPFPTPPDRHALKKAELTLTRLGALESDNKGKGQITSLGRTMAMFPLNPRFGKMLAHGMQHNCLPYVIAIVAGLSVGDPFLREEALEKESDTENGDSDREDIRVSSHIRSDEIREKEKNKGRRRAFFEAQKTHMALGNGQSDIFKMLSVIGAYEYSGGSSSFCSTHFVRLKAMEEIHKLRAQISNIVSTNFPDKDAGFSPQLPPPNTFQLKVLRQIITAGFIDQIAARKDVVEKSSTTKFASARGVAYRAIDIEEDVFIYPGCVLFQQTPPEYVAFQEVVRGSKVWMRTLTAVNPAWLAQLGPALCSFSKPIPIPPTMKGLKPNEVLVIPKYGPGWELPPIRKLKEQR